MEESKHMSHKRPLEFNLDTSIQPLSKIARKSFEKTSQNVSKIILNESLRLDKISKSVESEQNAAIYRQFLPKITKTLTNNATEDDVFKLNNLKRALELDFAEDHSLAKRSKIEKENDNAGVSKEEVNFSEMNAIIKNPGLHHIVEDIFRCLDKKIILNCRLINYSWKKILDQPIFWLKKLNEKSQNLCAMTFFTSNVCHFCGQQFFQNFKSHLIFAHFESYHHVKENIIKNWKTLSIRINDYIGICKDFTLILPKMYENHSSCHSFCQSKINLKWPLEIVHDLRKSQKFPDLKNFILEQECNDTKIDRTLFSDEENLLFYLAALNGLTRLIYRMNISYCRTQNGRTPVHAAAQNGHLNTVKLLRARFYNPYCADNQGITPIYLAAKNGHYNVVQFLAKLAFSLNHCPNTPAQDGRTPLHVAAEHGNLNIVMALVQATQGSNPNTPDKQGVTPMHLAVMNGHGNIIAILAPLIDNQLAKSDFGTSPIHYASNLIGQIH